MSKPNIAFVVLDTVRKDYFNEYFEWLPGQYFERAYAPSYWTVPVHASLFTGQYPSEIAVHAKSPQFDCDEPGIAEVLSKADYTTRAFSNNVNVSQRNDFHHGFDQFTGSWRLNPVDPDVDMFNWGKFTSDTAGEGLSRYVRAIWRIFRDDCDTFHSLRRGIRLKLGDIGIGNHADDGARETRDWVRSTEFDTEGEFLFINLMEAHAPYTPPRNYRSVKSQSIDGIMATVTEPSGDPSAIRQSYGDSVRYLADIYRDIHEALREDFDYVFTFADHGEMLGNHGAWGHVYGLYPELIHVPLSVWGPDCSGESSETVSLLDVHQTALDLADADGSSRGRNLFDPSEEIKVLTEYHGLYPQHRESLLEAGKSDVVRSLENPLNGIVLPEFYGYESRHGWLVEPESVQPTVDPQAELRSLRESVPWEEFEERSEISEDVRAQLEELGYA